MADKIRVGIVGANAERGSWGARAHIPALKLLPEFELKAICTAHEETAVAAARQFGAELAFHDLGTMLQNPDIDLVVVCVRVPYHHELTMQTIKAGKDVFCEWPLGANLREAEEMANGARSAGLASMVGLQNQADAVLNQIKDLVTDGYVGELLAVNLTSFGGGILERPMDRTWQGNPALGGNTLTISAGHAVDGMCYALGNFTEVSARLATQVKQWHASDTGAMVDVTSADNIMFSGVLDNGAVASVHVAAVPYNGSGWRLDIYGREGTLLASSGAGGERQLVGAKKGEALAVLPAPDRYNIVPEGMPKGPPYNVGQAYVRFADSRGSGTPQYPDFDHAVSLHGLIDAIQRSSDERRPVKID